MITCTVEVAGQPLGHVTEDLKDGAPTVADGLSVQWGRATRLDQPKASTCQFNVYLPDSAPATLAQFTPGIPVRVLSTNTSAEVETSQVIAHATARAITSTPYFFTPAPTSPATTDPTAWDHLPRIEVGATYTISLNASLPPHSTLHVRAAYFAAPHDTAYTTGATITTTTASGPLTATFTPPPEHAGTWLALAVHVQPLGATINAAPEIINADNHTLDDLTRATISALTCTRRSITKHRATVFSGRISDAVLSYSTKAARPKVEITAVDHSVDLANTMIGSEPWPKESAIQRARRILNLAASPALFIASSTTSDRAIALADVNNQSAARLLAALAASTGSLLWPAYHETVGDFYHLEDPSTRPSLYRLIVDKAGNAHLTPAPWNTLNISANVFHREGVSLRHDTTDLATSVSVSWQEEQNDQDGKPTLIDREETVHDVERRRRHGHHHLHITTNLTTRADALAIANQTLINTAPGSWTLPTAEWHTNTADTNPADVLTALDAARRIGLPVALTGVAEWVPGAPTIPAYLDGGTYTYERGRWTLALTLTRSTLAASITIDQAHPLTIERTPQTLDQLAAATI